MKNIKYIILLILFTASASLSAQEDSRYDSHLNLPFNEKAGDVNPQSGSVTINEIDVSLPGRGGLDFSFGRTWVTNRSNVYTMYWSDSAQNNALSSDTIEKRNRLGAGWSSNLPYIEKNEKPGADEYIENLFLEGSVYEIDTDGAANYIPTKSNLLGYDLLDKRIYESTGIAYSDSGLDIAALSANYSISDSSSDRSKYRLIFKDNSQVWFREDGSIMMREDRSRINRIWYFYDAEGKLKVSVDSVGREIAFTYDLNGNLSKISWKVEEWIKNTDGTRSLVEDTREVNYTYTDGESFTEILNLKDDVFEYEKPYALSTVTDPEGNVKKYEYEDKKASFTYNSRVSHWDNVYLLLTGITNVYAGENSYRNRRVFEYNAPTEELYTKWFYTGYMKYFKVTGDYYKNRHGEVMNKTRYIYHDKGESGNFNQYTAIIEKGGVRSTYTYSVSDEKSKDNVLSSILTETDDGFVELKEFTYNIERSKTLDEVFRGGEKVYEEKYVYDSRGNLKRLTDRMGLVTIKEYDPVYSIPVREWRKFSYNGKEENYEKEWTLTSLGQIEKEVLYLKDGYTVRAVKEKEYGYDTYGNVTSETDAENITTYYDYDSSTHSMPVRVWKDVKTKSYLSGSVDDNWKTDPDTEKRVRNRVWKVYNSDGKVYLDIDSFGNAVEHFYDKNGFEKETVNPDNDDYKGFYSEVTADEDGNIISGTDITEIYTEGSTGHITAFTDSRINNSGIRNTIDYLNDLIKTYTDIDKAGSAVKVTGVQGDGLGNTEEEIDYNSEGTVYAVKRMEYDSYGRMVSLTDKDAGTVGSGITVNGKRVIRYDKTWLVKYDALGRKILVVYPDTEDMSSSIKRISYNDLENSTTTVDPEGRKVVEIRDWSDNVIKVTGYGDSETGASDVQQYRYVYDPLSRKRKFTDPLGTDTFYTYDERDLLTEQDYGNGSDFMSYNDRRLLTKKSDRKSQVIEFTYDELGKAVLTVRKKYNGSIEEETSVIYDGRGNIVRVKGNSLIEHYKYDEKSQVTDLNRSVLVSDADLHTGLSSLFTGYTEGDSLSFTYKYNDLGMVTEMTYPDSSVHEFTYDSEFARLEKIGEGEDDVSVTDFITNLDYNKSGVVTVMDYFNGTKQAWDFDNRKRIKKIRVSSSTDETIEELNYKINGSGDITSINDNEYKYDGFDRIVGSKTSIPGKTDLIKLVKMHFGTYSGGDPLENGFTYSASADIAPEGSPDGRVNGDDFIKATIDMGLDETSAYDVESFGYDRAGNRIKLIQNGDEYTYEYGMRNRLERIYKREKGFIIRKLYAEYTYDKNGNTTGRIIHNSDGTESSTAFEYDTLNRLIKTTENSGISTYFYDNAGNRFFKKTSKGDRTLYLRHGQIAVAMDVEVPFDRSEVKGKVNRYILSGDLVAGRVTRTLNANDSVATEKSCYHLDHLNSTKLVTKSDETVEVSYTYRAFGEQLKRLDNLSKDTDDRAKYTYGGKELDDNTNLYYFNARYYDATTGRFINVDPVQDGTNWYVYCNNNPLSIIDPTGLENKSLLKEAGDIFKAEANYGAAVGFELKSPVAKFIVGGKIVEGNSSTANGQNNAYSKASFNAELSCNLLKSFEAYNTLSLESKVTNGDFLDLIPFNGVQKEKTSHAKTGVSFAGKEYNLVNIGNKKTTIDNEVSISASFLIGTVSLSINLDEAIDFTKKAVSTGIEKANKIIGEKKSEE